MPASRRLLTASLAAASLTLVACAKPGLEAVPAVPWESPSPSPAAPAAPGTSSPRPTEQVPDGTLPPETSAPSAPATSAPATAPATEAPATGVPSNSRASADPAPTPDAPAPTRPPAAPAAAPQAAGPVLLGRGATGDGVRDLQARLAQLDWFDGPVTGTYGPETAAAVEGFQSRRGLPATGAVDRATQDALRSMTRQPTAAELAGRPEAGPVVLGRGATGDRVRDLQARLAQLGWFSGKVTGNYGSATAQAVSDFQGKRGLPVTGDVDRATLDKLTAMTRVPTRAELGLEPTAAPTPAAPTVKPAVPAGIDPRCMTGRVLCISKDQNKLRWMVDGEVRQTLAVRFGTDEMPTREGAFNVGWKSRDHVSTIYHTPMPYAMFFSGGQAVHYSADFAARGYNGGSHGCVNVRDKAGIASLFDQVRVGDKVIVYH